MGSHSSSLHRVDIEGLAPVEQEPIQIHKLHLLIHPGFLAHHLEAADSPRAEQHFPLLDLYVQQASEVAKKSDELMVIFIPRDWTDIKEDIVANRRVIGKMQEIKHILGQRAIFMSDNHSPVSGDPAVVVRAVERIAKARGFIVSDAVTTEAYGEWFAACVTDGSTRLSNAAKWQSKTVLRPELTDLSVSPTPIEDLELYLRNAPSNTVGDLYIQDFTEVAIPEGWDIQENSGRY